LNLLASEPNLANLPGAEAPAAVAAIGAARGRLIERSGRERSGAEAPELAPGAEQRLLAGAFGLISDRVGAGEAERLAQLAEVLLMPYRAFER
jgi:hypothetical protein